MSSQQTLITTHSAETPSGRISYASAGFGPVALFVHGVVLNKHLWRHQLAGLSDIRRCIAVDLLAHGDTEITPDQDVSVTANLGNQRLEMQDGSIYKFLTAVTSQIFRIGAVIGLRLPCP